MRFLKQLQTGQRAIAAVASVYNLRVSTFSIFEKAYICLKGLTIKVSILVFEEPAIAEHHHLRVRIVGKKTFTAERKQFRNCIDPDSL